MRIFVVVNQVQEIGYRQTTALLIAAFVRLGHEVSLASVDDFSVDGSGQTGSEESRFLVACKTVPANEACDSNAVEDFAVSDLPMRQEIVQPGDLILIRTNPGRDKERTSVHDSLMNLCHAAKASGICVENDPTHMKFFASKASLVSVGPQYRPPLLVSTQVDAIADFVRQSGKDCVIKPLVGSRGQSVIRVQHDDAGLETLIPSIYGTECVVAQHFVDADHPGDKRVVVLDGKILEIEGHLAGIERRPAEKDFRANLHAGGTAHPLTLSDSARSTAEYAAKLLLEYGIRLAGVDLIGDRIIEFNVFSTGGLFDAESYSGVDFSSAIVNAMVSESSD